MIFIFLTFLTSFLTFADEKSLMQACAQHDLKACEELATYYLQRSDWDKSYLVGEVLCQKDIAIGCTFAGSSLLAQKKLKEANPFLTKACDKFEPLSCRSLGRLMKSAGEGPFAQTYFRRACHYGLKELCSEVKMNRNWYSASGLAQLERLKADCKNSNSEACAQQFITLKGCALPLTRQDCFLMAGYLSIYFHAVSFQAEAKYLLQQVFEEAKKLKEGKEQSYSYDLRKTWRHFRPQEKHFYGVGYMRKCTKKYIRERRSQSHSLDLFPKAYAHLDRRTKGNLAAFFTKGKAEDCYDQKSGYEAYAVGSLDPMNPSRLDVWKIDQDAKIEHIQDGLPQP
jgi:hypothetical protein